MHVHVRTQLQFDEEDSQVRFDEAARRLVLIKHREFVASSIDGLPLIRCDSRGKVENVRFSLNQRFAALQRSEVEIEFLDLLLGNTFRHVCKGCGSKSRWRILTYMWTGKPVSDFVVVTSAGVECYLVQPERNSLKLVKSIPVSTAWTLYSHETRLLLLATGAQDNLIHGMQIQPQAIVRLPKFEVQLAPAPPPESPPAAGQLKMRCSLQPAHLSVVRLYHMIMCAHIEPEKQVIHLYQLFKDFVMRKYSLSIYSRHATVSVSDNLLIVHALDSKVALIFDVKINSQFPVTAPLPIATVAADGFSSLYSPHWQMHAPDVLVDPQAGRVGKLSVDLRAVARSSIDMACLLQFLLARSDAHEVVLETLAKALREKVPLHALGRLFDIFHAAIAADVRFYASPEPACSSSVAATVAADGAAYDPFSSPPIVTPPNAAVPTASLPRPACTADASNVSGPSTSLSVQTEPNEDIPGDAQAAQRVRADTEESSSTYQASYRSASTSMVSSEPSPQYVAFALSQHPRASVDMLAAVEPDSMLGHVSAPFAEMQPSATAMDGSEPPPPPQTSVLPPLPVPDQGAASSAAHATLANVSDDCDPAPRSGDEEAVVTCALSALSTADPPSSNEREEGGIEPSTPAAPNRRAVSHATPPSAPVAIAGMHRGPKACEGMASKVIEFIFVPAVAALPPVVDSRCPERRYVIAALTELIHSQQTHSLPPDDDTGLLLLNLLAEQGSYYQIHQHVQYNIVPDSPRLAALLLSLDDVFPPAAALAKDILRRLGPSANEVVIDRLLQQGELVTACRFIRQQQLLAYPAFPLLRAASACDDKQTFATVFSFLLQRNEVWRGSAAFLPEDGCDEFVHRWLEDGSGFVARADQAPLSA